MGQGNNKTICFKGHLDCLKYAIENGCEYDKKKYLSFVKSNVSDDSVVLRKEYEDIKKYLEELK